MHKNDVIRDLDLDNKKSSIANVTKVESSIPTGYIPISLSMGGKFDVPKTVHCRNFTTVELVDISLFDDKYLTERVISILNSAIYEDTDVALWPDMAIIELLINIYANFFSVNIEDVEFPWNEEDLAWLRSKGKDDLAEKLEKGLWKPKINIPLTSVKTKEIKEDIKSYVTFTKKDKEGKVLFSSKFHAYPRFGDVLLLEKIVEAKFSEAEKEFEPIKKKMELKDRLISQGKDDSIVEVTEKEYFSYQLHEVNKIKYLTLASMAIYLVEYNGKDMRNVPVEEKIIIVSQPEFDITLGNKLTKRFKEIDFGIDPEVEVENPIQGGVSKRHFTFQIMALLQTIQASESDGYDISYDD